MPSIGTAIGAGASILGGRSSAKASNNAANLQAQGLAAQIAEDRRQYDQNRTDTEAWRKVGTEAQYTLGDMLGLQVDGRTPNADVDNIMGDFTLDQFKADPGYQFRLNEGNKAIDRGASAKGNYFSGSTMKDLLRYGQDYSSNEFSNAFNRDSVEKDRKYNYLSGVSGSGQNSTNQVMNTNSQIASNIGNAYSSTGNVRAAGAVGANNAMQQGFSNAFNNYTMGNLLNNPSAIPSYAPSPSYGGGGAGSAIPGYYG